jgi:hypothetical protein
VIWPELAQRDKDILSMRPSGHCPAPGAPPATIDPVSHAESLITALEHQLVGARLGSPGHADAAHLFRDASRTISALADAAEFADVDSLERARLVAGLLDTHAASPHFVPRDILVRAVNVLREMIEVVRAAK